MKVNVISESEYFPKGHGVHTAYLNTIYMLRQKGIEVVVNSLGPADIVHVHTLGPLGLYKLKTSPRKVVSAHVIPESYIGSLKWTNYWIGAATKYLKYAYNSADIVIAVAPKVKESLLGIGVTAKIEIIPNFIDITRFAPNTQLRKKGRNLLRLNDSDFLLIGVGQIQTRKGIEDFIEVGRKLPGYRLLWIGNQPFKSITDESQSLKTELHELPSNVQIIGPFSYDEMPEIYNAADVFFFPTLQENAPMAVIEAAAAHLPLLLRDIPELKILYKKDYLGAKTNTEFITVIEKLANDKTFYKKSEVSASDLARRFSADTIGDTLIEAYRELLK